MYYCKRCGNEINGITLSDLCKECAKKDKEEIVRTRKRVLENEIEKHEVAKALVPSIMATTAPSFDGFDIIEYICIESAEVIVGTGLVSEFLAGFSDLIGDRSKSIENKLSLAKKEALNILKYKVAYQGGNSIIGIDFDYITLEHNMLGVVANGTGVRVSPKTKNVSEVY